MTDHFMCSNLLRIVSATFTLFYGSYAYSFSSDPALSEPSRSLLSENQIIPSGEFTVRLEIPISADSAPLRGLVVTEEIPEGFSVVTSTVRVDSTTGVDLGISPLIGSVGDIYSDSYPASWMIETREAFALDGAAVYPLNGSTTVYIDYTLQATTEVGVFSLTNLSTFGLLDNNSSGSPDTGDTSVFSYSESMDILTVVQSTFELWKILNQVQDAEDESDADGDGHSLLAEYYFGLDPATYDSQRLELIYNAPEVTLDLSSLTAADVADVAITYETSNDLKKWTDTSLPLVVPEGTTKVFLRVRFSPTTADE